MMTSLIITGKHVIVIIDNGTEVLSGTFDYSETLKIVCGFYDQNEKVVRNVMYPFVDDDETPDPEKPVFFRKVKSSTFDELLDSLQHTPKKKVAKSNSLEKAFDEFLNSSDDWTPPKTVRVEKNELEEVANAAGIFSNTPNPEDLVGGGIEGDSDEYEADYLAGLKAGVRDRTEGNEAVYYAGDQLGADSTRHAQYIDGYINGYN